MEGFYPIYATAQSTFGVNWLLLASIHRQESAFSTAPSTYHGLNFAHCCGGPMQFNVTNGAAGIPSTWDLVSDSYIYGKRPAHYDHMTATHPSIYDDFDAIMAAAHLLSADGAEYALDESAWDAAYDYYGHDATGVTYADQVLARAIGWSQHGFCINCGVEPAMVEAVYAAYGAPVLAALEAEAKPKPRCAKAKREGGGGYARAPGSRAERVGARRRRPARAARRRPGRSRWPVPPSSRRESCARRKYSGASCSQVAPMPPWTEIIVRAASSSARPADRAGGAGGERELRRRAAARPAGVVEQRAPVLELAQHLGEGVLDRLVGADGAAEGEALLGVGDGHVERGLDAAERLGGDQRLREVPGGGERLLGRVEHDGGRVLERDVAERAGRVIALHGLDPHPGGVG